jgi:hypothetical protein
MKRIKLIAALGALSALVLFQGAVVSWAQQEQLGTITYASGDVTIARAGTPAGQAVPVSAGVQEPLFAGDVVRTGATGRAELVLRDESVITLVEEAEFEVVEAAFDPAAGQRSTTVRLLRGMARVVVQPLPGGGTPDSRFTLETPTAVVGVRGSESVVQAPSPTDPRTILWVLYSIWQAQNADPSIPKIVDVPPEFFSEIFKGQPPTTPKPIPPEILEWLRQVTTLMKRLAMGQDGGPPLPDDLRRIPPGWPPWLMPNTPHKDLLEFGPPFHQDPSIIPEPQQPPGKDGGRRDIITDGQ